MLSLTRLFLHHWRRFSAATLDIDSGLCLTGPDDADSAAALDALQLVLLGDPARVRFSQSRYGFTYDLESYARGRLTEDQWQRPGNTVSYVIAEFTNAHDNAKLTLGLCLETGPRLPTEITWFSLADQLNPNTFVTKGRPLPRIELKPLLRNWRGAHYFDNPLDYQAELLNCLGGLEDRFFDLIQRALHYQPLRRADEFACAWFFDEQTLDLTRLRRMRDRLGQLRAEHDRAEKQLNALQPIVKSQAELARLTQLRDGQILLTALLQATAASRHVSKLDSQISELQAQLAAARADYAAAQKTYADLESQLREAERLEFEHGLSHRRTILHWQQRYATLAADTLQQRWSSLQRQFQAAADHLRKITGLAAEEQTALNDLLAAVDAATHPDQASPGPALAAGLDTAIPILLSAHERLHAERTRLADQLASLKQQLDRLRVTTRLPDYPTTRLPDPILRMQAILEPIIGKKPPLLYEFIEVTDPRWQNAVEAMLGARRFHAIVSATWFNAARSAIDNARQAQDLKDADVHDPTQLYNRPAQPGSLAHKVSTIYPDLRAYLETLLGGIIAVESVDELRRAKHPRAIMPDCVVYSDWHTYTIPFTDYEPLVIGQHASRLSAETRQKHLDAVQSPISNLQSQLTVLDAALAGLAQAQTLALLRAGLNDSLDERPARAEAAAYEAELRGLELTPVIELQNKAQQLREAMARQNAVKDEISRRIVALELELRSYRNDLSAARAALNERDAQMAAARAQFASLAAAADEALPPHLKPDDLVAEIKSIEQKERDFDKKVRDERQRLVEAISAFSAVYQLGPALGDPNDPRYGEAFKRLGETEFPRLKEQIASAEQDIEEELRDHILRPLREQLTAVGRTLDPINDTLAELGSPYRLRADPAPETKDFYSLILNVGSPSGLAVAPAPISPTSPISPLSPDMGALFYETLTTQPEAASRLIDYRRYFTYAIETQNAEGQTVRFIGADGDAQLAFYTAIAASFVQLYRIRGDRAGRPCLRLLPFGAAFARMEAALITPVLELFKRFGLQLAAAVPLERSDYLIANLPTTVVLTPVGNTVLAEPYRNYAALPAMEAQSQPE